MNSFMAASFPIMLELLVLSSAQVGVFIHSTRLFYPVENSETSLGVTNNATTPQ
ncbi:hypothetical protein LVQ79_13690 [Buttiauxella sp. A2-C1_F]|uniref:hypothetical protein n=1 Tax=unclassified Buttiauxella TaxID=2634062 RepID=UPI001E42FA58|nr:MULTISPECIES: hypothetical protein [unclassified Buttiauxella]MCE0801445.1 hypothetical protein [Buttiauxella sp. W03-F01]MCE0814335.1 hypothetical protein [Buttiauxella sp. S04-F03]MCE0846604.1 hypothetical protein [Buttiauxella sp. A2-C1_F]